jgi:hypothetical protein
MAQRYSKRRWTKRRVNVHQRSKKRELRTIKKEDRSETKGREGEHVLVLAYVDWCSLWDMASGDRLTLVPCK